MSPQVLQPTPHELSVILNCSVQESADRLNRSRQVIRRWRKQYAPGLISKPGRPRRDLPVPLLESLGKVSDMSLAKQYNVPENTVRNYRIERSIESYQRQSAANR